VYTAPVLSADPGAAQYWLRGLGWRQGLRLLREAPLWSSRLDEDQAANQLLDRLVDAAIEALIEAMRNLSDPAWQRLMAVHARAAMAPLEPPPVLVLHRGEVLGRYRQVVPDPLGSRRLWPGIAALLDAGTSPMTAQRAMAAADLIVRHGRGGLVAHMQMEGCVATDRATTTVIAHDNHLHVTVAGLPTYQATWDGRGWILPGTPQQPIRRIPAGDLRPAGIAGSLLEAWMELGRFIPDRLLSRPERLSSWARGVLREQVPRAGLFEDDLFDDGFRASDWWASTLAQPMRAARRAVEQTFGDQRLLRVHARVRAAGRLQAALPDLGPLDLDAFWDHPHLVEDVLRCDEAAVILRALIVAQDAGRSQALMARGWAAACSHPAQPSRTLRRTLGRISLATWPRHDRFSILGLRHLHLRRPMDGLSLEVALVLGSWAERGAPHPAADLWLGASAAAIDDAIERWRMHRRDGLWGQVRGRGHIDGIADCLDHLQPARSLRHYIDDSLAWHDRTGRVGPGVFRLDHPHPIEGLPPGPTPLVPMPVVLPAAADAAHLRMRQLLTVDDLIAEGIHMRHCIGSETYAKLGISGDAYFLHIDYGPHAATVELDRELHVRQARGPGNTKNLAAAWAEQCLGDVLNRLRVRRS
jgi:hypothetical protein